jgi:hypothetical protein
MELWNGLIWLRIGFSDRLVWTRRWTLSFTKAGHLLTTWPIITCWGRRSEVFSTIKMLGAVVVTWVITRCYQPYVRFVTDEQGFLRVLRISLIAVIPPVLHHRPTRCEIALTKKHIIIPSVLRGFTSDHAPHWCRIALAYVLPKQW